MPDFIFDPAPLPLQGAQAQDEHFYNAVATIYLMRKSAYVKDDVFPSNIRCRVYPIVNTRGAEGYVTARDYTDRIRLDGYFPRMSSRHYAEATGPSGETVMYTVKDVEHDGDCKHTTLLCQREGLDRS